MLPVSVLPLNTPKHYPLDTQAINRIKGALDPARVKEALCSEWHAAESEEWRIGDCTVLRLFDYGGGQFVISYMIELKNGSNRKKLNLHGEIADTDPWSVAQEINRKLSKRRRRQIDPDVTGPVFALPSLGLVLRPFGLDEKIDGMRVSRKPKLLVQQIAAATHDEPREFFVKGIELLAHRLGKRAVYRCRYKSGEGDYGSVILKLYKPGTGKARAAYETLRTLYQAGLDGRSGARVPIALCYLDALEGFLMEDAAGQMPELGDSEASADRMARTGAAIAQMHRTEIRTQRSYGAADEIGLLGQWLDIVTLFEPELGEQVQYQFARLRRDLMSLPAPDRALIHRDFHEKQILIDHGTTAIIDFDTIAVGDPAIDIGNFIAHLRWAGAQKGISAECAETSFLLGYREAIGRDLPPQWPVYCRAALLRLVCLNAFSSQMKLLVPLLFGLLDRSET